MILGRAITAIILAALPLPNMAVGFQRDDPAEAAAKRPVEIQLTDGGVATGSIVAIDDDGIELMTRSSPTPLSFEQIASIAFKPSTTNSDSKPTPKPNPNPDFAVTVTFVDGSHANAGSVQIAGDTATVISTAQTTINAKVSNLRTICLLGSDATDAEQEQWKELLEQPSPDADAIVVSKNGSLQLIEGIVGDVSDSHLTFSMESRTAEVTLEKIKGVLFYRADRELTDPLCQLTLTDGSSFAVRKIEMGGDSFIFTSVDGTQQTAAPDQMQRLDFSAGRFVYLSDLIPATNTWTPLVASDEILESLRALRMAKFNRDFRGQPLTLKTAPASGLDYLSQTMTYEKGIAIAGGGRIVFAVNGQFKRLTGLVGFDPAAFVGGEVNFVIKTDGQTAISERLRVLEVSRPIALDLDIGQTKRVSIAVEYADGKPAGDILHLVDFKVLR